MFGLSLALGGYRAATRIMTDLIHGSIARHILRLSAPVLAFMVLQALYFVISLYFVADLGKAAIAGVSAAANATFAASSLTQVLGVGTTVLVSHATGRKDEADTNRILNQAISLAISLGVCVLVAGYILTPAYMQTVAADAETAAAGEAYLNWVMPSFALGFVFQAMGSALRGTGIVQPVIIVCAITLVFEIVLTPVLIAGWGTSHPMGVGGVGLANSIAVMLSVVLIWQYLRRLKGHRLTPEWGQWRPSPSQWKRILNIGLPAGGEMVLTFVSTAMMFWAMRHFGAAAQAGFGAGSRISLIFLLPVLALSFATAPVAGQNFGAGDATRVMQTFRVAAALITAFTFAFMLLMRWYSESWIRFFTNEVQVVAVGAVFLQVTALGLIPRGLVLACASLFQGIGRTWPAMAGAGVSLAVLTVPTLWLSGRSGFRIEHLWYWSIAAVVVEAVVCLILLRAQFRSQLPSLRLEVQPQRPS